MGFEAFIKDQIAKREARGRSPKFQAEIAKEKAEFMSILGGMGKNTFELGVTALLKTPTSVFLNSMKLIYAEKYKFANYRDDAFKLFFGKNGIAHSTLKVAANAIHLAGQGAKISVRQLFKL